MASLMAARRPELKPCEEKGTQNSRQFQMNERGQQAGRTPVENETAVAIVFPARTRGPVYMLMSVEASAWGDASAWGMLVQGGC